MYTHMHTDVCVYVFIYLFMLIMIVQIQKKPVSRQKQNIHIYFWLVFFTFFFFFFCFLWACPHHVRGRERQAVALFSRPALLVGNEKSQQTLRRAKQQKRDKHSHTFEQRERRSHVQHTVTAFYFIHLQTLYFAPLNFDQWPQSQLKWNAECASNARNDSVF